MKQTFLILQAQEYRILDENTGTVNEGISLTYLPSDNLDPTEDELSKTRGQMSRGIKYAKASLPLSMKHKVGIFPALYEASLEMAVVQQKLQVRMSDIEFVGIVKLTVDKSARATA